MEKSHCCKDNTATQYSPSSKLLANNNYLILRNPLWVFISDLFLQIEEPKAEIKWFVQGHSRWAQVSELYSRDWARSGLSYPPLNLSSSLAAGREAQACAQALQQASADVVKTVLCNRLVPLCSPVPGLSMAEGAVRPMCFWVPLIFGLHALQRYRCSMVGMFLVRCSGKGYPISLQFLSIWLDQHMHNRDCQLQNEKNTWFRWPADLNMQHTICIWQTQSWFLPTLPAVTLDFPLPFCPFSLELAGVQ